MLLSKRNVPSNCLTNKLIKTIWSFLIERKVCTNSIYIAFLIKTELCKMLLNCFCYFEKTDARPGAGFKYLNVKNEVLHSSAYACRVLNISLLTFNICKNRVSCRIYSASRACKPIKISNKNLTGQNFYRAKILILYTFL